MTNRSTPWDEIKSPGSDYNVRLVANAKAVPLYWGKDPNGHCLFIVELDGDHSQQFQKAKVNIRGLKADLRMMTTSGKQGLVLALEQHVDRDLFLGLCETLADSLREVPDSPTALSVTLAHLKRWKAFLSGKKARLLSPEEVRGLFVELQFLRGLYENHLSEKAALSAWCGPEGGHQDFIFGNTAVEIKALSGKERSTVRISSEDQLQAVCDNLFLKIYRLSDMPESDRSISLNEMVRLVEHELTDPAAIEQLSAKLVAYGYVEMRDYNEPALAVTGEQTYRVEDGFPMLVRSQLPAGLTRVSYEIELETITPFECDEAEMLEEV